MTFRIGSIPKIDPSIYPEVWMTARPFWPQNWWFNLRMHMWCKYSTKKYHTIVGCRFHNHPWWSVGILLKGRMLELFPDGSQRELRKFRPYFRNTSFVHATELITDTAVSIFMTGPPDGSVQPYLD